ncbi:hypothetical protein U1R68_13585 [Pectobacterium colocasium]|uniref:hypothetical protein n=1 Tax=Pectobacterium colocasium TaxID=2878098 RepID=UPI003305B3C1
MTKKCLTDADYEGLENLLNVALDGYKNGEMSSEIAMCGLSHVIAAIDSGNYTEARYWFRNTDLVKEEIGGGETFD